MDHTERQVRRKELESTELVRLVSIYRSIMGLDEVQPLPAGMTFSGLIDAILDRFEATGEPALQSKAKKDEYSRPSQQGPRK
jgi:hypothetical protein